MKKLLTMIMTAVLGASALSAQQVKTETTAASLFWRSDSLQVAEIVTEPGDYYRKVGHHGPAVENTYMALRIYFNDSGAIDVYSKSGRGMELMKYLWYPSAEDRQSLELGYDDYRVGKTVGLGGIALWDGKEMVRLEVTKGRTARVGKTKKGAYAEMVAYGVPYCGDHVDICIRIDVTSKTRDAVVTATELTGKKVSFVTGVNWHEGQKVSFDEGYVSVWGPHPDGKGNMSKPIGSGMFYNAKDFESVTKTDDMIRLISRPASRISTRVVAASTREAELNNAKRFEAYMIK